MRSSSFGNEDTYFINDEGKKINWGRYPCEVLKVNPYIIGNGYLVLLPDGNTAWASYDPNATPTKVHSTCTTYEPITIPESPADCGDLCTD